jgi:predicted alpha/beta hydrolase
MQAASDSFLGWCRVRGLDGRSRDFYVRQLWDGKGSTDVEGMPAEALEIYARLCGWTLARAHARSGDPTAIGAYLGSGSVFDEALAEFSRRYADQAERDHAALLEAIGSGRIAAEDA